LKHIFELLTNFEKVDLRLVK